MICQKAFAITVQWYHFYIQWGRTYKSLADADRVASCHDLSVMDMSAVTTVGNVWAPKWLLAPLSGTREEISQDKPTRTSADYIYLPTSNIHCTI